MISLTGKRWKKEELDFVLNNLHHDIDTLVVLFKKEVGDTRSYEAIREKRVRLIREHNLQEVYGNRSNNAFVWTEEEDELIRNNIDDNQNELYKKFLNKFGNIRSRSAVIVRRCNMRKQKVELDKKEELQKEFGINNERRKWLIKRNQRNAMLKDFSELTVGKEYRVKSNEAGAKWITGSYLYTNDFNVYFRTNYGYIEAFPRNRNLIRIRDINTGDIVSRPINFSQKDRV